MNKMDGIRDLLTQYKFDALALNETFLSPDINDTELIIPGYRLARKDRSKSPKSSGGGVIIFIRDNIPFVVRPDLTDNSTEILWLEITRDKCKPLLTVYRPPDYSQSDFIDSVNSSIAKINGNNYEIAILGDFNLDQTPGKDRPAIRLEKSFSIENHLKQLICESTRITENSRTMIDLLFVNNEHRIVQSGVIHTSLSDHSIIYCVMKAGVKKAPPRIYETRSFKNYDQSALVRDLAQAPWSIVDSACSDEKTCVDDAVHLWEQLFLDVANVHAPIKTQRRKGHQTPWVTSKLTEIRRDRDYHHKKARKSTSKYHWDMYKKLKNLANREDKRLQSEYFCNLINDSKGVSGKMWKSLKQVIPDSKSTVKEVQSLKVKNKVYTKLSDIFEIFNKHFSTIGHKLGQCFGRFIDADQFRSKTEATFSLNPVSESFVRDQLQQLKPNKAIGLYKISSRLLKDSADVIAPVLTSIINCSFRNKFFPQSWK